MHESPLQRCIWSAFIVSILKICISLFETKLTTQQGEEMAAVALSTDKRTPAEFHVDGSQIKVEVRAQQPIMVYRSKEAVRVG